MPFRKHAALTEKLIAHSELGSLPWRAVEGREAFAVSFRNHQVVVEERRLSEGGDRSLLRAEDVIYLASLCDKNGKVLETFSSQDLTEFGGPECGRKLKAVYFMARRHAMGVDRVLDELLAALT